MKNVERLSNTEEIIFDFICECEECGAEGELVLQQKDGMKPFNCPEGCGSVYIPWRNPLNLRKWELKAVVMPVFSAPKATRTKT